MDSLDDDFNETETREFITDSLKAKRANQIEGTGIQQAINYCNLLKAPFAASSNGKSFVFTDLLTGHEEEFSMEEFPAQDELWNKFVQGNLKR